MRWLLIDRILHCEPGAKIVASKTFPRSDLIFMDHFPGFPIVPGVLQIEMIAQAAGKCAALANPDVLPVLGSVKSAKFYSHVHPGDLCRIEARVVKSAKTYLLGEGEIMVEGRRVCAANLLFGLIDRTKLASESFDAVSKEWLERNQKGAHT